MVDYQSTQMALLNTVPVSYPAVNEIGGRVRIQHATLDNVAQNLAINDRVRIARLPAGAKFIGFEVQHTAWTALCTMDIGTDANDDLYAAALDMTGTTAYRDPIITTLALAALSADTDIWILNEGAIAIIGTAEIFIFYTLD